MTSVLNRPLMVSASERIAIAVADAADRRLDAGIRKPFGIADRDILHAAIAVVDETAFVHGTPVVKRLLERICLDAGWPFQRWTRFSEIEAWLAATLATFDADPGSLAPVPPGAPPPRGFFCGPEVWGEGLVDPPEGSWPPP